MQSSDLALLAPCNADHACLTMPAMQVHLIVGQQRCQSRSAINSECMIRHPFAAWRLFTDASAHALQHFSAHAASQLPLHYCSIVVSYTAWLLICICNTSVSVLSTALQPGDGTRSALMRRTQRSGCSGHAMAPCGCLLQFSLACDVQHHVPYARLLSATGQHQAARRAPLLSWQRKAHRLMLPSSGVGWSRWAQGTISGITTRHRIPHDSSWRVLNAVLP